METLEAMANIVYPVVFLVVIFACVVRNNSKSQKPSGDLNATDTAHDTYPEATTPVAATPASEQAAGALNATGTSHHTYLKVTAPAHKKPNIWKQFLNSTSCTIGFAAIVSVLPILYFLVLIGECFSSQFAALFIVLLCIPFAAIGYCMIFLCYLGLSALYFSVALLILNIMNREMPAWPIYCTAVYANAPMFVVTTFVPLIYYSSTFFIGIAITAGFTAGFMFFAIRHILKEQESECIYISAAIRQHIRQHGFMHAAF